MNLPTDTQYLAFLESVPIGEVRSAPKRDDFFKASETAATPRRTLRALAALLHRPMPRERLDSLAGCSNGPELVAELRRRGLEVPCERVSYIDHDGQKCYPGVYSLTTADSRQPTADRRKLHQWMSKRKQKGGV
jgi:hypothetical protein